MVLGAHWLRTLGLILWDFLNLWMQFIWEGKTYQLKGENVKDPTILKPSKLRKTVSGRGMLLQLCSIQVASSSNQIDQELEDLMLQYEDIFAEPKELPPITTQDLRNPLLEGTRPAFMRPYR